MSPEQIQRIYSDLADLYHRQGQARDRDRFLVLAADAALTAGNPAEADRLLRLLLGFNRHHFLKPYPSFTEALRSPDVRDYLGDLRRNYPPSKATELLGVQGVAESPSGVVFAAAQPPAPVAAPKRVCPSCDKTYEADYRDAFCRCGAELVEAWAAPPRVQAFAPAPAPIALPPPAPARAAPAPTFVAPQPPAPVAAPKRVCPSCGKTYEADYRDDFCGCGAELVEARAAPPPACAAPRAPKPLPPPPQPEPTPPLPLPPPSKIARFLGWLFRSRPRCSPPVPASTPPLTDDVTLAVFGPRVVVPDSDFTLDVSAYLPQYEQEVRGALAADMKMLKDKTPVQIDRGAELLLFLELEGFDIRDRQDTLRWTGTRSAATFPVHAPAELRLGGHNGTVKVCVQGLQVAKIHFTVQVGQQAEQTAALPCHTNLHRTAFASYASQDRDAVLGRIQGIQKIVPYMDIFLDVHDLRSGEDWKERIQQEVVRRDLLYLFWSVYAKQSEYVDWEWRVALRNKGLAGIDPVPLVDPEDAAPPPELAALHFRDWVLAFQRKSPR